jgi:hypothetical protein
MFITIENTLSVGKYLVSPLTRSNESGQYTASVSLRNGSHDRVLRFTPEFSTKEAAARYAVAEGRRWIRQRFA